MSAELQQAEKMRVDERFNEAISIAKSSMEKSLRSNQILDAIKAIVILNNCYGNMDDYKEAVVYEEKAMKLAQDSKDSVGLAYAFLAKAYTQYSIGNSDEVVKYCNQALHWLGNRNENYLAAKINILLYAIHSNWNHIKQVNQFARQALHHALLTNDFNLISNCYFAVSVAEEYNYSQKDESASLEKIVAPLNQIIQLQQKHKGKVSHKILAMAYVNKSDYYFKYFSENDRQARKAAMDNAQYAFAEAKNVKYSQELVASTYGTLSGFAIRDGNLPLAESYLLKAYEVMHTNEKVYHYTMLNVLNGLVEVSEKMGNYRKALTFQKEATDYSQKLFDTEQMKSSQKLEVQFETEKKNSEIKLLAEKGNNHKKQNRLFMALIAIALVGSFFMFRSYNYRLKYSLEREKTLQVQKQEAELQAKLEREERERLKAEQDLLTYQQQQLQKEAMAGALHLEHKNEVLQSLKKRLEVNETVDLRKILREENLLDVDFEKAIFRIKEVNPGFFKTLSERSKNKLTPLDLKYCAYFHLDMDTKQIATLLNVEPKSVRMTKYRLKQKLNLHKDEELGDYLRKVG